MEKSDAVLVSELYHEFQRPNTVGVNVSIDLMRLSQYTPDIMMKAISEAVAAYVEKNQADRIYAQIERNVIDQISERVANQLFTHILKKLDLDALAKLTAIHAAKNIGEEIK